MNSVATSLVLIPGAVALLVLLVFTYLYEQNRHSYFRAWQLAWAAYTLHYAVQAVEYYYAPSAILFLLSSHFERTSPPSDVDAVLAPSGFPLTSASNILVLGSDRRQKNSKEPGAETTGPGRSAGGDCGARSSTSSGGGLVPGEAPTTETDRARRRLPSKGTRPPRARRTI